MSPSIVLTVHHTAKRISNIASPAAFAKIARMQFISALHGANGPSRRHRAATLRRKYEVENTGGA